MHTAFEPPVNVWGLRPGAAASITILVVLGAMLSGCVGPAQIRHYDAVVYGGTAAGAAAAIAAANEGLSVALLEPRDHIGGMVSGGLGRTDFGNQQVVGGMSREFFERLGQHYGEPIAWYFEPHAAEQVFRAWLEEAGVDVFYRQPLWNVHKQGTGINWITTRTGSVFMADVYIDASYEGDLMARAGVSYTWGREGRDAYGESLAGRLEYSPKHQFDVPISAYDEKGQLLPHVHAGDSGEPGQADRKVQAYNFRLCLCDREDNQVPFTKPAGYDPGQYEILKRYLAARGDELVLNDIMIVSPMPNGKTDVNNRGPFSSDHIGGSWDYPDADDETRQAIWEDHVRYTQGWLYFLTHDPSVPTHIQEELSRYGLAKDEFTDTGHWSHQLYIREARRMIGDYVMRQSDLQTERNKPDSIGMGSYNIDSHNVQRIVSAEGTLLNEGDMQIPVQPYEIAYRSIVPQSAECNNLLVPVAMSASHVAYSSIRMEPVYMILGQSSGVAAAHAVAQSVAVQDVDMETLQDRLRDMGQILSLANIPAPHIDVSSLRGIAIDNTRSIVTGHWVESSSTGPFVGHSYLHDNNENKGLDTVRFVPQLTSAGVYEVRVFYSPHPNRASNTPITVHTSDGAKHMRINQRQLPADAAYLSLGVFLLEAGKAAMVEIGNADTDGYVIADTVQWVPVEH